MLYLMLLCGFILVFNLLCFAFLMRKRLSHPMVLGICIVSFVFSMLFPFRYVLCNPLLKEQVSITALHEKNDASFGTDVVIQYIDTNYSERRLENPVEGKWAWWNGTYKWSEEWERQGLHPTDAITMELPVGTDRYVNFSVGPGYGMVEISCLESNQTVDLYSEWESILAVGVPASLHDDIVKDRLLRAATCAGVEILIILSVTVIAVFLNRKTNWRIFLKWKWEAFVFLLSLINIVLMGQYPDVFSYPLSCYCMPYEGGFNSRGLTGEITMFLGGPYIEIREMARFILVVLFLTYLFGSFLIVHLAKLESDWRMGLFWVLLYLLTPMTFLQIYDDARPDIYLIIIFLIQIILINKKRFLQLIPAICVVMLLINETSSVFFIATLLALLLYCSFKERDIDYLISFLNCSVFTCITTLGILRIDRGKLISLDSFFAHMQLHTDIPLEYRAFKAEYRDSASLFNDFATMTGNQYHPHYGLLIQSILYFLLLIPFVILFVILWKAIHKKLTLQYKDSGASLLCAKFLFWIVLLASCGGMVCMLMAYDYPRFTEFIMIAAMASMFTLIHKENLALKVNDLYLFTPSKRDFPLLPFAILLYMKYWGTLEAWAYNTKLLVNLTKIITGFLGFWRDI